MTIYDSASQSTLTDEPVIQGSKSGGKGKGGGGGSNASNTLRSKARARWVEIISEGPCVGIVGSPWGKGVYFEQTPVVNENGTKNFENVKIWQRLGYPDQEHLNGVPQVETPFQVETQVKFNVGPIVRTINEENADSVRVIMRLPALVKQNSKSGKLETASVSYGIDVRGYAGTWVRAHTEEIVNQKTTSAVQRAHRVELPLGGHPWDIRVVRLTEDSDEDTLSNDTFFESYTVLVEGKFTYPNTALVAMEVNAEDMGQSVPARNYRYRGLIVSVPSNYNPTTRVYTGVWNGTFKQAWTNNPAWIFYDLLTNDRYGLGEFVSAQIVDKWSLYQIAQYCDAQVKTGFKNTTTGADIYEPRYTFNGVLRSREDAWRVLQQISTAWRGMAYWSLGQVFATADMPEDPVKLFSPANVIGGEFNYSGTSQKARHSVALVTYNNPDDFYRSDIEPVINEEGLQRWGWREKAVALQGCTSRSLAHRYGKWILDTEQNETETVDFTASWDSTDVRPGNIIAVADPAKAQVRIGGRLKAAETQKLWLDFPFKPVNGSTYQIYATMPDGEVKLLEIDHFENEVFVDGQSAGYDRVALKIAQSTLPLVNSMWVIRGTDIQPRLYRVITIKEDKKNLFKITALFHDPNKFARVEDMKSLIPTTYSRPKNESLPPENLQVREVSYLVNGQPKSSLTLSWSNPLDYLTKEYEVAVLSPDSGYNTIGTTRNNSIDVSDLADGEYTFYVYAINHSSVRSLPASLVYEVAGWQVSPLAKVTDLVLVGGDTATTFVGTEINVKWTNNFPATTDTTKTDGTPSDIRSPFFAYNTVQVYEAQSNVLLREERVYNQRYTYSLAMNIADGKAVGNIGPSRNVRFEVSVTDTLSRTSAEALLTVNNPVPASFQPSVSPNGKMLFLRWNLPNELDVRGSLIWISTQQGFNPLQTAPYFDGTGTVLSYIGAASTTYYIRAAAYDSFGKTGLNISPEMSVSTLAEFDLTPPNQPTGLAVASSATKDGRAKMVSTWTANSESDLAYYDVQIKEGTGNYVSFISSTNRHEIEVFAGVSFTVRARAVDKLGNASAFSTEVAHVAAADTVAPAVPTGLTTTGTFKGAWIQWTPNTEIDLEYYEIYESATNAAPATGAAATFTKQTSSTFYRSDLPEGVTRYYRLRAVDTSGNKSAWTAAVAVATLTFDGQVPAPAVPAGLTLASEVSITAQGNVTATIRVTWTAVAGASGYDIGITGGTAAEAFSSTGSNSFEFTGLPGIVYKVRLRSVGPSGSKSAHTAQSTITPAGDTVAPAVPSALTATAGFQEIWLKWAGGTENDFSFFEVYESTTSTAPVAGTAATFTTPATTQPRTSLAAGTQFNYWVRAVDTSGNKSAWSPVATATTLTLDGTQPAPVAPVAPTLSSTLVAQNGGGFVAKVRATWAAVANATSYEIGVLRAGATESFITSGTNSVEFDGVPGVAYTVRVLSVGNVGQKSAYGPTTVITPAGDAAAPATPTGLAAIGGYGVVWLKFNRNTESDLRLYEVYESASTTAPVAGTAATYATFSETFVRQGLTGVTTFNYWIRAVDYTGNKSAWSARVAATTSDIDTSITTEKLAGLIDMTSYAAGLTGMGIGTALPAAPFTATTPKTFYNTTDKTNYIQKTDGSGWLKQSDASLIVGQLVAGQIAAGAIGADQIGANAVTAKHLVVTDSNNLILNGNFQQGLDGWTRLTGNVSVIDTATGPSKTAIVLTRTTTEASATFGANFNNAGTEPFGIFAAAGDQLYVECWAMCTVAGSNTIVDLPRRAKSDGGISSLGGINANLTTANVWQKVSTPINVGIDCYIYPRAANGVNNSTLQVSDIRVLRRNAAKLVVDGSLTANMVTTGEFITGAAQIKNAIIGDAHISSLSAALLRAGTALAATITVSGTALSTINSNAALGAQDPATRINAASTKIDPGKIVISGATTLADWRGTDTTTINGGAIEANTIKIKSVLVADGQNLIQNGNLEDTDNAYDYWGAVGAGNSISYVVDPTTALTGPSFIRLQKATLTASMNSLSIFFTSCVPGEVLQWETAIKGNAAAALGAYVRLHWYTSAKATMSTPQYTDLVNNGAITTSWVPREGKITVPANAAFCRLQLYNHSTNTTASQVDYDRLIIRRANGAVTIANGSLTAPMVTAGEFITTAAQIKNAIIGDAHITSLSAALLRAGTALAATLTISGTALSTVQSNAALGAQDPASRINSASTQIDPGKIVISGGTTLANWRGLTDTTKIFGGSIETDTITARQLLLGDFSNMVVNDWTSGNTEGWSIGAGGGYSYLASEATQPQGSHRVNANTRDQASSPWMTASPDEVYYLSVWVYNAATENANLMLNCVDAVGANPVWITAQATTVKNAWLRLEGRVTVPAGKSRVRILLQCDKTATGGNHTWWAKPVLRRATGNVMIENGAISADKLVTTSAVITGTAQLADAVVTTAKIASLNADKINVGGLNAGITVGSTGVSIGTVESRAGNPAARINAVATTIDPGKILISGGTTLANWRSGSDTTKIEGGNLSTNSVNANSLKIGSRGLTVAGFNFRIESGVLTWDTGYVSYTNDAGGQDTITVNAGSIGYNGWTGIYFQKGNVNLHWRNDSNGGWNNLATNDTCVLFCTWQGGASLAVTYGGTIIDGSQIVTGTVKAAQIGADQIQGIHVQSDTMESRHLKTDSINARHLVLTDFDNLVPNGNFQQGLSPHETLSFSGPTGAGMYTESGANNNSGSTYLVIDRSTSPGDCVITSKNGIPVAPGEVMAISVAVRGGANFGNGLYVRMVWLNKDGAGIGEAVNIYENGSYSTTWTSIKGQATAPANAKFCLFRLYANGGTGPGQYVLVDDIRISRAYGASLIVQGSISADKMNVGQLSEVATDAGTITAGKLQSADGKMVVDLTGKRIVMSD
ncbi:TipJ family phage tail tip protein [Pararhizobium qamdonense]|uniref:TipJ family phage tail tip protein n=1 Tax=Pararhizobium qamdonense TaxID=3031126 RepID=UPI0023E2F148|nr:phage tail protein [Pararhizobium qamdonense]